MSVPGGAAPWNIDPAVGGVDRSSNSPACPATGVPVGCGHLLETKAK